ncbi:MAG: F0F1 ATP synthase subunit A [Anaerolineales bacterium]
MAEAPRPRRRIGFKRWIVLGLIVLGGYLAFGVGGIFKPVSPAVKLPGEAIYPGAAITNTLLSVLITDLLLFGIAFLSVQGFVRSRKQAPSGFYNFFEFLIEFLWNTAQSTAGKWARRMFPFMASIFLLVFVGNMVKLLPGFESIGYLEQAHGTVQGYAPVHLFGNVYAIDGSRPVPHEEEAAAEGEGEAAAAEGEHTLCTSCEVVPFLRGAATDLNFTFALAVAAVVLVEVFGVWALGARYFGKFFNTGGMISRPFFGVIDFLVGLLELVSEFAKVLSFGFRLFGNIFAGALLLSILGALTAIIVPSMLYALEIFVGIIQAYVFAMLALVFMSQATVGHHGDEHSAAH